MRSFLAKHSDQVTLSNWRQAPFNRWAFHHVRELVPTADIPNDATIARSFSIDLTDLSDLTVRGDKKLRLDRALKLTNTDGIIVLSRGTLVYEHYENGLGAETPHILMSVSKSLLGLLCGILIDRGELDPNRAISDILPALATTAYSGATIRDLLDMRAGVYFEEDYLASSGPIIAYRKATNWNPLEPGEKPSDLRTFFQEMRQSLGPHGGHFNYVSPNTDLLGWVIEQVTGRRYADLISELLWKPIRAWRSAYITVDGLGAPRCAGGFCATLRDLALIGQVVAQNGQIDGVQIVPREWIADMARNGDPTAWFAAPFSQNFPGREIHYRSQWYAQRNRDPMLFALGIHGQWLFVDHRQNIVMAKLSSQEEPLDSAKIALTMDIFDGLRDVLKY